MLDTNALSLFLKNQKNWSQFLHEKYDLGKTIICVSIFSIGELKVKSDLFEKYLNLFSNFPSAILDGLDGLIRREKENYEIKDALIPIVILPFTLKDGNTDTKVLLKKAFAEAEFDEKFKYWKNGSEDVIEGILKLIDNYPPKGKRYSLNEIEDFVNISGFQQLALRDYNFCKSILEKGEEVDMSRFPSIKSSSYYVFYKFYKDRKMRSKSSDMFDLIISSLTPYVDIFISEGNLVEIFRQIQSKHNFLENLELLSVKEISKEF